MIYKEIIYDVANRVATIRLNRPERLNGWTNTMAEEVRGSLHRAAEDKEVRVIVLTGAGRGFCAGADMSELEAAAGSPHPAATAPSVFQTAEQRVSDIMGAKTEEELDSGNRFHARTDFRKRYSYIAAIPKPVIAAINGPAAGLGLVIALYCDLRFASEKAIFTTAFSRRGLIAEHGISWILPRIVGLPHALDMLLSARRLDAHEALRLGLVNRIFPHEALMEGVMAYAAELASLVSPRSLGVIKKQVYDAQFQTLAQASEVADQELIASLQSEDFQEGVAHFLEKRPPAFTGK
ncbi:MAG: enoyl-CoA hydratase [Syntrophobacteraceae bacterium]|nr:enoyl-CoA hydratase [Syntrophobacteraceae bacterium]